MAGGAGDSLAASQPAAHSRRKSSSKAWCAAWRMISGCRWKKASCCARSARCCIVRCRRYCAARAQLVEHPEWRRPGSRLDPARRERILRGARGCAAGTGASICVCARRGSARGWLSASNSSRRNARFEVFMTTPVPCFCLWFHDRIRRDSCMPVNVARNSGDTWREQGTFRGAHVAPRVTIREPGSEESADGRGERLDVDEEGVVSFERGERHEFGRGAGGFEGRRRSRSVR